MIAARLHQWSLIRAWARFDSAACNPIRVQRQRLQRVVTACGDTVYGRHVGLERVGSIESFQATVPIVTYDDIGSFVERAASGESRVLTREPIRFFERTSGSTAANKLIPYTEGMLREVSSATSPWLYDLYRTFPALLDTRSYWSISPAVRAAEHTSGGIPIGAPSDREYFGALGRWALRRLFAVDESTARISDVDAWREETCRQLAEARDLGFISVWSPTFLLLLMERLGRAAALLWPRLVLVSCWTEADSQRYVAELRRWFPSTPIQPKGLLATEGVVSIPIGAETTEPGAVAAVTGHFLEFIDLAHPEATPRLAHELEPGAAYSPVLTTSAGLLRYHLRDVVECVGRWRALPRLAFRGRLDGASDLCGEKLGPRQAENALAASGLAYAFALVAPAQDHYVLYVDTEADDDALERAARQMDETLCDATHYAYCRRLGQLGPVRAERVRAGQETYRRALLAGGRRLGDLKGSLLDARLDWAEVFHT